MFLYVCPKVVLLNEYNIALFAFRLHSVTEVLLFLYVYPHVVSLDLSDDAPFAFLIIFVIQWETPLKQSNLGGAILTTLRHDCKNLTYTFIESMNCDREKSDCEPAAALHEKLSS